MAGRARNIALPGVRQPRSYERFAAGGRYCRGDGHSGGHHCGGADRWKEGFALNPERSLTEALGLFSRLSWNDGRTEPWAVTDIDQSFTLGLTLKGASWGRAKDTVGIAGALNGLSRSINYSSPMAVLASLPATAASITRPKASLRLITPAP